MALELRMNNVGDGYVQICCFANINQLVFYRSRCRRRRRCLSSIFFYCVGKRVEEKRSVGFLVAVFYKSFFDQASVGRDAWMLALFFFGFLLSSTVFVSAHKNAIKDLPL